MSALVTCRTARPCPRCGGEKLLSHSHICGYCYEILMLGGPVSHEIHGDPAEASGLTPQQQQLIDFHFGAGLAVGLGATAVGVGTMAAAWVVAVGELSAATLACAALAFLGAAGVTFGGLTSACLLRLRAQRPCAVLGLTDTLLGWPRRQARALWREIRRLSGADMPDPLALEEDEWP
jgi:hypothetical protein